MKKGIKRAEKKQRMGTMYKRFYSMPQTARELTKRNIDYLPLLNQRLARDIVLGSLGNGRGMEWHARG